MGCCNCKDPCIHELHAELIHKARDIQFQISYTNGVDAATIICIDQTNVQFALESYWSQVGIPIKNEVPLGAKDHVNLTYMTLEEFIPGTLEVFLSGDKLKGKQTDPDRDYDVITTGPNAYKAFIILLAPLLGHRLNVPPQQDECLEVNYAKRITFSTKGGN